MRHVISGTAVQTTSFAFLRQGRDNQLWWYTVNRSATGGTWSIIRRKQDTAPISPYMQILCNASETDERPGCFHPVIGNDLTVHRFANEEAAVRYIEENF